MNNTITNKKDVMPKKDGFTIYDGEWGAKMSKDNRIEKPPEMPFCENAACLRCASLPHHPDQCYANRARYLVAVEGIGKSMQVYYLCRECTQKVQKAAVNQNYGVNISEIKLE